MKYRLVYTKRVLKDIEKLDSVVKKQIGNKILLLVKNPLKNAKKLIDSRLGQYRWRIGNYRIIFDIEGADIVIFRMRHRKEIYK